MSPNSPLSGHNSNNHNNQSWLYFAFYRNISCHSMGHKISKPAGQTPTHTSSNSLPPTGHHKRGSQWRHDCHSQPSAGSYLVKGNRGHYNILQIRLIHKERGCKLNALTQGKNQGKLLKTHKIDAFPHKRKHQNDNSSYLKPPMTSRLD